MRIIYDQQNQWRDARRSLLYKSLCVCVRSFLFPDWIPWSTENVIKCPYPKSTFFKNLHVPTNLFIYIYIHILKIHIGDWYFHTTSRASIFFGPPTTSPPFVPGCGYPKICICQTETPAKVQTNITGACLDGSTSLSSTTVPQKSAVGSTGSETFQMQMAVG